MRRLVRLALFLIEGPYFWEILAILMAVAIGAAMIWGGGR